MGTVSTTEFLREVVPFCPDVMEIVALNAIRNAAIEFCRETTVHRTAMTAVPAVADQAEYTIPVPDDTELALVLDLYCGSMKLVPTTVEELARYHGSTNWQEMAGQPVAYTQIAPGTVRLFPTPDEGATDMVTGLIALMPTRDAVILHDGLYIRYVEDIAMGARSRLHYQPGTSYYDASLAEMCRTRFVAGIAAARASANKGNTRASITVKYNKF